MGRVIAWVADAFTAELDLGPGPLAPWRTGGGAFQRHRSVLGGGVVGAQGMGGGAALGACGRKASRAK